MKILAIKPVSMTSLEISNLTEVRHDNVKRTIERLVEQEVITLPQSEETSFKNKIGRKQNVSVYTFTGEAGKRDCLVLLTQLSSRFAGKVVDRWLELESKEADRQKHALSRRQASDLYIEQSGIIHDKNMEDGKEDKFYQFSNEADMVNRIIFGCSAKQYKARYGLKGDDSIRDWMLTEELDAINDLQRINASLISVDVPFEERKKALTKRFMKAHNPKLCEIYTSTDKYI